MLGIDSVQAPPYDPGVLFITSTKKALDNNNDANARNQATSINDRWIFGSHSVGKFNGKYYDPTFGLKSFVNIEGNVYAKQTATPVSEGGVTYTLYKRLDDPTKFIKVRGTGEFTLHGWSISEYKNPALNATVSSGALLLGIEDAGLDTDGDGLFNFLRVNVEINVTESDIYSVDSILRSDDVPISVGSLSMGLGINLSACDSTEYLTDGMNVVTLYFSGYDIHEAGIDGNYSLDIMLNRAETQADAKTFNTSYYNHSQFQGLTLEVVNVSDFGYDEDGDGRFDVLTARIDLNSLRDASYDISGYLLGIDSASSSGYLTKGMHTVYLNFSGSKIRASRTNESYSLELLLADEYYSKHMDYNTSLYSYTQFEKPQAEFTGAISDYGVDLDSNGLFDFLCTNVTVDVSVAGNYTVLGYLLDTTGNSITMTGNFTYFNVGISTTLLNFDGTAIYANGRDGPYTLRSLQILDADENLIDNIDQAYNSTAYSFTSFERPSASFTETYSDYGVDTDIGYTYNQSYLQHQWIGNGIPMNWSDDDNCWGCILPFDFPFYGTNYTTIYVSTNGLITFLYPDTSYSNSIPELASRLAIAPAWDDWVTYDIFTWHNFTHAGIRWFVHPYGSEAVANFETILSPDGRIQFNYGYSNETVSTTIGISNGAGDVHAIDVTDLNNINTIAFTPTGDGLFNVLAIQAGMNISKAGRYTLEGSLQDDAGALIAWTTSEYELSAGTQVLLLNFDGSAIYSHGVNGSYNLGLLRIYDESGNLIDARHNLYNTTAYNYTDFQKPQIELTGVFSDYGTDEDLNGLYDYLTIEIQIVVQIAGSYEANARLIDSNGNEIIWASTSTYLDSGTPQTIQLNFDGRYIFGNGVNGSYYVKDLSIYYSTMSFYVTDVYSTSAHNYTDFEKAATIVGEVRDAGGLPVVNALVYISAVDYEYTNINGSYKLIILQTGTYTVEVTPPSELNLLGNSTTVDILVGQMTTLNFVLQPAGTHDIAVVNVGSLKTIVCEGYCVNITVNLVNQGNFSENFLVRLHVNSTFIGSRNMTLASGATANFTFLWNSTGFAKGVYLTSSTADPVVGETDTADNTLTGNWIAVTIVGDINADKKVDVKDVYAVARAYGTSITGPNPPGRTYDPNCDINEDGKIDVKDYYTVCRNYGKTDP